MSVIQRIRDKATWVFIIIAVALIAFILQDAARRDTGLMSSSGSIGKVNGLSIDRKTYDATREYFKRIANVQNMQVEEGQLFSQAWERVVQLTLFKKECDKLGISFTGKELSEMLLNNPPSLVKHAFTDPNTGEYDINRMRNFLRQIKTKGNNLAIVKDYDDYIQPAIDEAMEQKYQVLLLSGVYIPKWMSEKMSSDNSSIAKASYVYVPYATVQDSAKVSDDDINAYLKKYEKEFQRKTEGRVITYVSFDASPSSKDSAVIRDGLNELKSEFAAATDEKYFVSMKGSAKQFSNNYVIKNEMKDAFADSIMGLSKGEVYGPYVEGANYLLAKMIDKRLMPDSVKCRYVLVVNQDQGKPVADSVSKKKIDSIATIVKAGGNFSEIAQKYSADGGGKEKNGENEFTSSQFGALVNTFNKELAETIFYGTTGEKKVVKIDNANFSGYCYIEILGQKNIQEAYKVAYISKPIVVSQETSSEASTAAQQFAAAARDKKSFDTEATKMHYMPGISSDIAANDFSVRGLGDNREFVRWVYEHKVGDVSDPVDFKDKYAVAIITTINKPGLISPSEARLYVEIPLKNEKKAKLILNKMKGNSLETYAQSMGITVEHSDSLLFENAIVTGIGNEPKLIGAAFNKNLQSKISEPIVGLSGVFVVQSGGVNAVPSMNSETERSQMETQLRRKAIYNSNALYEAATIKDNRFKIYR